MKTQVQVFRNGSIQDTHILEVDHAQAARQKEAEFRLLGMAPARMLTTESLTVMVRNESWVFTPLEDAELPLTAPIIIEEMRLPDTPVKEMVPDLMQEFVACLSLSWHNLDDSARQGSAKFIEFMALKQFEEAESFAFWGMNGSALVLKRSVENELWTVANRIAKASIERRDFAALAKV